MQIMKIKAQSLTRIALVVLLTVGGIGTAVAAQPPDVVTSDGSGNTAMGSGALLRLSSGSENTASGDEALYSNTAGSYNTASGVQVLFYNTTGTDNTASGFRALERNTTGNNNIGIGYQSGMFATGSNNIEIGNNGLGADNNVIRIGTQGKQKFTAIAGIGGVNVTGGAPVYVNTKGQLGVVLSSIRYKENVHSMGTASERLLKLRPVTFQYKQAEDNGTKPEQYGLIAEEVAKVMPELVVYNEKGQPETVAYQTLTPLLLNELQREHAQIIKLQHEHAQIVNMQAQIDELLKARK